MRQSTIDAYTNENYGLNSTHGNAWAMAYRAQKRTWRNMFPPSFVNVVLLPSDNKAPIPTERFDAGMFKPGQPFHNWPLNHYIALEKNGIHFYINAGFLVNKFAWGDKMGYAALKEAITHAENNASRSTTESVEEVPEGGVTVG